MKLSPNDPKLTAYALGELDPAEVEAVERELKESAELRQAVEEIRQASNWLSKELTNEEPLSLEPSQKEKIKQELKASNIIPLFETRSQHAFALGSIAAVLIFGIFFAWLMLKGLNSLPIPPEKDLANSELIDKERRAELTEESRSASETVELAESQQRPITARNDPDTQVATLSQQPEPEQVVSTQVPSLLENTGSIHSLSAISPASAPSSGTVAITPNNLSASAYDTTRGQTLSALPLQESKLDTKRTTTYANPVHQSSEQRLIESTDQAAKALGQFFAKRPTKTVPPTRSASPARGELALNGRSAKQEWVEQFDYKKPLPHDDFFEPPVERQRTRGFYDDRSTARYPRYVENNFESVRQSPLSTFSIDVDTASYANVRRFLNEGQMPPRDAVRVEELINYFTYNYSLPRGDEPFSVNMETAGCPWNNKHRLLRVGLKGKEIAQDKRPPSNFVFLIDVSGSMSPQERLPLIKQALRMLVKRMTENDRIAMVVYASSSGVVLESTSCMNKEKILEAIDKLEAGGSTNGGEGIQKAYALAEEHFIKGGVNRVILATDGDFNVGITSQDDLIDLIQRKAKSGVFLSALGVGTDNYKDALLQKLADKGNGNYNYLDSLEEAEKVLIQQMNGTLVTIAKDVKIQIEFNPAQVKSYRLIGYEKRILEAQDFNNDKKDAGEIGAGHTVTALYEIVPTNIEEDDEVRPEVDDLKYQKRQVKEKKPRSELRMAKENQEMLTLKLRYKKTDGNTSKLSEFTLNDDEKKFSSASDDFRFAAAVAGFGMLLKDSEYKGDFTLQQVAEVAKRAKGDDKEGYRADFINLVKRAKELSRE